MIDPLQLAKYVAAKTIKLSAGAHRAPTKIGDELCLMEAAAHMAGEPHSDHPQCVDPVFAAFGRAINDWMTNDERQRLVEFIPLVLNTRRGDDVSIRRGMYLADAAVRQLVPMALDAAGLQLDAAKLRGLKAIIDEESAESAARSARSAAESAARSARSAAESAARSAAWSAESAARSAAARSAAESAAESAQSAQSAAQSAQSAAQSAQSAQSAAQSAQSAAQSAARAHVIDVVLSAFRAAIEIGS